MALIYIFANLFNIHLKIAGNLLPAFAFNVTMLLWLKFMNQIGMQLQKGGVSSQPFHIILGIIFDNISN